MVFLAVYPDGSKIAPNIATKSRLVADRLFVKASRGNNKTENADIKSEKILIALALNFAIKIPPNGAITSADIEESATTKPANAGEPVTSSVNHGMAIMTIAFEIPEEKFETCSRTTGSIEA